MNIIQSYYTNVLKANLSLYEMRILIKLVEHCQAAIKGDLAKMYINEKICTDGFNYNLTLSTKEILTDNSHHYEHVYSACSSLMKKIVTYYDSTNKQWSATPMIYNVIVYEKQGAVRISCAKWLVDVILDFGKGFTKYDLETSMKITNKYALRLYIITSGMKSPVNFRIDYLKEIFGVNGTNPATGHPYYTQTRDFIKRVVESSKQYLINENYNGFDYEIIKNAIGKIIGIKLWEIRRQPLSEKELTARATISAWCPRDLQIYLMQQIGFTQRELSANKNTLFQFTHINDWQDILMCIIDRYRRKRAKKGYIIASLKSEIENNKTSIY